MSAEEKIVTYVDGQAVPEPTECFAIRGVTMIDLIHPLTGKTAIFGKTLEDYQADPDYAGAERMTIEEFCQSKATTQDTPILWEETTEERYDEMLGCLPPALYTSSGFLVGESWDHHALTGRPRYQALIYKGKQYFQSSRPMTCKEFKELQP